MLLNSKVTLDVARAFANRVRAEVGDDPIRVIDRAFRIAFGRAPDADELATMCAFLERQTAHLRGQKGIDAPDAVAVADLCHALSNLNEFLYVD